MIAQLGGVDRGRYEFAISVGEELVLASIDFLASTTAARTDEFRGFHVRAIEPPALSEASLPTDSCPISNTKER